MQPRTVFPTPYQANPWICQIFFSTAETMACEEEEGLSAYCHIQASMPPSVSASLSFQLNNAAVLACDGGLLSTHLCHMVPVTLNASGANGVCRLSKSAKISSHTAIPLKFLKYLSVVVPLPRWCMTMSLKG